MKICCPQCLKEYHLDAKKMIPPKYDENNGWGWIFLCDACQYQWWQKLNLNDHQSSQASLDLSTEAPLKILRPGPPPLTIDRTEEDFLKIAFSKKTKSKLWIILGVILFLCTAAFGILYYIKKSEVPLSFEMKKLSLSIQKVRWYSTKTDQNEFQIHVMGEINNPNEEPSLLPSLQISAFGPCPQDNEKKCMITTWDHIWQKPHLLPKEKIAFKTLARLPSETEIKMIKVNLN